MQNEEISYATIASVFGEYLEGKSLLQDTPFAKLLRSCIETNHRLWQLEDKVRMKEKGFEHVAQAKDQINETNMSRYPTILAVDRLLGDALGNNPSGGGTFYAETPGMLIDRLAIIFIRRSEIEKLQQVLGEPDLKEEFDKKLKIVSGQIADIGVFIDAYISRIKNGEVFFKIQEPIKLYGDERVRAEIEKLRGS